MFRTPIHKCSREVVGCTALQLGEVIVPGRRVLDSARTSQAYPGNSLCETDLQARAENVVRKYQVLVEQPRGQVSKTVEKRRH
jgi:hypothetical protein